MARPPWRASTRISRRGAAGVAEAVLRPRSDVEPPTELSVLAHSGRGNEDGRDDDVVLDHADERMRGRLTREERPPGRRGLLTLPRDDER